MGYLNWNDTIFNQPVEIKTSDSVINYNTIYTEISSNINNTGKINVTSSILSAIKSAISSGKVLVIPAGIYLVSKLSIPANAKIHCMEGSLFLHDIVTEKYQRCIIFDQPNVTITGRLSVDGNYDKQNYDSEHIHNIAIFGATNLKIESIYSINSKADGVSISGGDGSTQTSYTTGIRIGYMKCIKAKRKNLVIEHVTDCIIDVAILDNTQGSATGQGGHCLDVEPYNYNGHIVNNTIKYLYIKGSGADFSSSISSTGRNYVTNINTYVADILALKTAYNDANNNEYLTPIYLFGSTVNIGNMKVNLPSTGHPNWTSWDKISNYPAIIIGEYAGKCTIDSVVVKGGVSGKSLFLGSYNSYGGISGAPNITINYLKADVNNQYIVNANSIENFTVNHYMINNMAGQSTSRTGTKGSITFGVRDTYVEDSTEVNTEPKLAEPSNDMKNLFNINGKLNYLDDGKTTTTYIPTVDGYKMTIKAYNGVCGSRGQQIEVEPNTDYTVILNLPTSQDTNIYVTKAGGEELYATRWRSNVLVKFKFNSGNNKIIYLTFLTMSVTGTKLSVVENCMLLKGDFVNNSPSYLPYS